MPVTAIQLSTGFTKDHQRALVQYVINPNGMTQAERQTLFQAIDRLRDSQVTVDGATLTFSEFYRRFVDEAYADVFINTLLASDTVEEVGKRYKNRVKLEIPTRFAQEGWYLPKVLETRFLLAFCLYWWEAFSTGYTFEVAILQDLADSELEFQAHDLRQRTERYTEADFVISSLVGDVKSSAYFFFAARSAELPHDLYITRYYNTSTRTYHRFVILKAQHWQRINGETQAISFPNWSSVLPSPASFQYAGVQFVAVDYEQWKQKMLKYQKQHGGNPNANQTH
jgi:hypothetical protein